jgi:SAM-dependent methyltransferase
MGRLGWRRSPPLRRFAAGLPPDVAPFSEEYAERHRELVTELLHRNDILDRFARARRLPRAYGIGMDERMIEYPWLLAQNPRGRALDAGSALNHAHILDRFLPLFAELHIVTLAPEEAAFTGRGVSYVYADLRDLPFRDAYYDTIMSISTLEHVGMNNARYGVASSADKDPGDALRVAVDELKRVLSPGGLLLVTLPYGFEEDHGWFRQFDRDAVTELVDAIAPCEVTVSVYAYSRRGWQRSSLEAAADLHYHDVTLHNEYAEDLAAAARGVVCLRAQR